MNLTEYAWIFRPVLGGIIGGITNYIAVKMMFRPLRPIKIGKWTLPLTPGIIPKNQNRLANAIGNSISDNLLTEEVLKKFLLSDEIKAEVREKVVDFLNLQTENQTRFKDILVNLIDEENYNALENKIIAVLTDNVYTAIKEADMGNIIEEKIEQAAKESIQNSMLGMLGGNAIVSIIARESSEKINTFIDDEGKDFVFDLIKEEVDIYLKNPISEITTRIGTSDIDLVKIVMDVYEKFITEKISGILKTINISKIVSDKISSMDPRELEKLILGIMKKELNILVWLGVLIGFILGLFNLLI